jgi:hypothetical protein
MCAPGTLFASDGVPMFAPSAVVSNAVINQRTPEEWLS